MWARYEIVGVLKRKPILEGKVAIERERGYK